MGSLDLLREVSVLSEHKTLLLSIVLFSEQIPRYFAVTICLSRGFLKCSFLKTGREGFRSWGSPLWIMPPNCPFLSPILVSYQMHPENFFCCVPPKRSIPILQLSVEQNSLDLSLEKHNLGRLFFVSQQQLCLEYLLFSNPRWGYFSSACRKKATNATNAPVSQTCNHDTRDDADNYMTIFFILSTIDKEFLNSSRKTGLQTVWVFHVNPFLHFRSWRGYLFWVRFSCVFHFFPHSLTASRGMRVQKKAIVSIWTKSTCLLLKTLQSSARRRSFVTFLVLRAFA